MLAPQRAKLTMALRLLPVDEFQAPADDVCLTYPHRHRDDASWTMEAAYYRDAVSATEGLLGGDSIEPSATACKCCKIECSWSAGCTTEGKRMQLRPAALSLTLQVVLGPALEVLSALGADGHQLHVQAHGDQLVVAGLGLQAPTHSRRV